jgi:hypothetical protein
MSLYKLRTPRTSPGGSNATTTTPQRRILPWRGTVKAQIRLTVIAASIIVPGPVARAVAQVAVPEPIFVQLSGPGSAHPTEHVSFCYQKVDYPYTPENRGDNEEGAFVARKKATVTLRIIEAHTGIVRAKKVIAVTPGALPSDPCVEYVVPAVASIASLIGAVPPAATPASYIGVVSVSGQPLPPSVVTSSLQIFTLGQNGLPSNVRIIPPVVTCPANDYPCVY